MTHELRSYIPKDWHAITQTCVGENEHQTLHVRHNGVGEQYGGTPASPIYWPAFYYLLEAGCSEDDILKVMDVHSHLSIPEFTPIQDVYALSLSELQALLETRLAPWYALANPSLNNDSARGFNRHGLEDHVRIIANGTVQLLKDSEYDEMEQKIGLIMAYGHDLGNVLTRKFHSLASPYILEKYVPELKQKEDVWETICQGIEFHNEPVIMKYVEARGNKRDFSHISPAALALIATDKMHVGPGRVSDKVADIAELINSDPHFVVNLLLETTVARLQLDGTFLWRLEFQPTLSTEEQQRNLARIKQNPYQNPAMVDKKFVPQWMHTAHRDLNIPHAYSVDSQLWKIYIERNVLAIRALFALNPAIALIKVEVVDPEDGITIKHSFERASAETTIQSHLDVFGSNKRT